MKNKFATQMGRSNTELRSARAESAAMVAKMEQEALLNELQRKKLDLKNQIEDLTDFGPDNTTSLRPTSRDFDAKKWVKSLHDLKLELLNVGVELEIAQSVYDEWFKEAPEVRTITTTSAPASAPVVDVADNEDQTQG